MSKLENEIAAILEILREGIRRPGGTGWLPEDKILSQISPEMSRGIFEFATEELKKEGLIDISQHFDGYVDFLLYRVTQAGL